MEEEALAARSSRLFLVPWLRANDSQATQESLVLRRTWSPWTQHYFSSAELPRSRLLRRRHTCWARARAAHGGGTQVRGAGSPVSPVLETGTPPGAASLRERPAGVPPDWKTAVPRSSGGFLGDDWRSASVCPRDRLRQHVGERVPGAWASGKASGSGSTGRGCVCRWGPATSAPSVSADAQFQLRLRLRAVMSELILSKLVAGFWSR